MLFKLLLAIHRWLGVALCALFLLWFLSGIGMMYWGMPAISAADRLSRWPALDPARIVLSPAEAAERAGVETAAQARLNSFDGRPVYRFGGGGGRGGGPARIVYADTGELQVEAPARIRHRAAEAWTGQLVSSAIVESVTEPDQWIVGNQLRNLRPLWKYSWPNGEQLYIGASGEVLLYTTPRSRLAAYVSAIPHWLYFTPLRENQPVWIRLTTYAAMIGTAGAIIGVVLGVWLYSPSKKYRFAGVPSRVPYRGQKRWHTIFGLTFGVATVTWTLSGSLAFLPFPTPQRTPPPQVQSPQPRLTGPRGGGAGGAGAPAAGRGGGTQNLAAALRGRVALTDYTHPRDLVMTHTVLEIRELELTSVLGQPLYNAFLADGSAQLMTMDGEPIPGFGEDALVATVKRVAPNPEAVEIRTVHEYDYYYIDRRGQRPLPVILAEMHDEAGTRHYIDPKTGTVAGTFTERNWARRFFYNGLHSLSFPWLYTRRLLWDIVVITFMLGGAALSTTAMVLAWRAVGKKLRQLLRRAPQPAALPG